MRRSTSFACAVTAAITMGVSFSVGALHIGDEQHQTVNETMSKVQVIQDGALGGGGLPDSVLGALGSALVVGRCVKHPHPHKARHTRKASR